MTKTRVVICPYCGETQAADERCRVCGGFFEPLSRQATHNEMGPWFIRDAGQPFRPGCAYETLVRLIERGIVTKYSVIRGPTTKQFWTVARRVPGVAHLLGFCHSCDADVVADDDGCPACGVPFGAYLERNFLGLPEVAPLPGEAPTGGDEEYAGDRAGGTPGEYVVQGGPASGGVEGMQGAAEAKLAAATVGLSSFAADDELLGRPTSVSAAVPGAKEDGGDLLTNPAVRSMQVRLARQQWTIRTLAVLVLVVAVAGAVFNLATVSAMRRPTPSAPEEIAEPGAGSETLAKPPEVGAAGAASDGGVEEFGGREAHEVDGLESSMIEPQDQDATSEFPEGAAATGGSDPDDLQPPSFPPAESPPLSSALFGVYAAEYERAVKLTVNADDDTRTIDARIEDYEEALAVFANIAAKVPEGAATEELADHISAAEDAVERLRLREFFP